MKVLIATEGSSFSEAAIDEFCRMFDEDEDTEIRIVTAIEPAYVAAAGFGAIPAYIPDIEAVNEKTAERSASSAKARILERLPRLQGDVSIKVEVGAAQKVIIDEAEKWGADLIIVGSHGYGFWERALLGSVSHY